jgi:glutamate synthase (NADPH/NADH) large chain
MTGRNFAAGMSGGIAYVYDEDGSFEGRCNPAMVSLEKVLPELRQPKGDPMHNGKSDEAQLKSLVERHAAYTGSARAKALLANWDAAREKFVKVFPNEYRRALGEMASTSRKQAA